MNIANLQLALFNQSFSAKENRLIFMATPEAPKPAEAPKPKLDEKDKQEIAPLTPDQLKTKMTEKIAALNKQMDEIATNEKGEYSKKLADEVKSLRVSLDVLSTAVQAAVTTEADAKDKLSNMYAATREMEKDVSTDLLSLDKQTVALKKLVEEKRAQFTPELVAQELTKMAGVQGIEIKPEDINTLNLFLEKMFTGTQDLIDAIKPAESAKALPALEEAVKNLNLEVIATNYLAVISDDGGKKVIAGIAEIGQMEAKSPAAQKVKKDAIVGLVTMVIEGKTDDTTPALIATIKANIEKADGIDKVSDGLYTKAAGILKSYEAKLDGKEITAEDLKLAITTYDPGKHENGTQSEASKKIIKVLIEYRNALEKNGVSVDFLGGTDGSNHGLVRMPEWHKAKAAALTKFLELQAAGNLGGSSIATPELELVNEYIKAANAGKGYEFVRDSGANQGSFLNGQGIFDKALAIQRADNAKKQIEGDKYQPINAKDTVSLEIGANPDDVNQRKSGIRLRENEENSIIDDPNTITMTPEDLEGLISEIEWKKNPDHPSQKGKGKETDPGECSGDGQIGRKYKGTDGYDYYQKGDDGEWKKIIVKAPDAPKAPEVKGEKDHSYSLSKDGKVLTVRFKGEKAPKDYTLVIPEGLTVKVDINKDDKTDNFIRITSKDGKKGGWFDFNADKALESGYSVGKEDLLESYNINLDGNTISVVSKTADETIKYKCDQALEVLSEKYGVKNIFTLSDREYDYNDVLKNIPSLDTALSAIQKYDPQEFAKLANIDIVLMDQAWKNASDPEGLQESSEGYKFIAVDYDEDADDIKEDILGALKKLPAPEPKEESLKAAKKHPPSRFEVEELTERWKNEDTAFSLSAVGPSVAIKFGKNKTPVIVGIGEVVALAALADKNSFAWGVDPSQEGGYGVKLSFKNKGVEHGVTIKQSGLLLSPPNGFLWQNYKADLSDSVITITPRWEDTESLNDTKADLLKQINDLDLDFNGSGNKEKRSRERFVDEIILSAKKTKVMPGSDFLSRLGLKKGDKVDYGNPDDKIDNFFNTDNNAKWEAKIDVALLDIKAGRPIPVG